MRGMQKSACPALRRDVMSLRNECRPRLTSETTHAAKFADKHARSARILEYSSMWRGSGSQCCDFGHALQKNMFRVHTTVIRLNVTLGKIDVSHQKSKS